MKFLSTNDPAGSASLSDALLSGAAPDGGLYFPEDFPEVDFTGFKGRGLSGRAQRLLTPFFDGDALAPRLGAFCEAAFAWPVPVCEPRGAGDYWTLELFHGPAGAFKDHGARFLREALDALGDDADPFTVLVATSGDTGGAVGAAFEGAERARAVILFPKGRVSPFQRHQLTCWGDGVTALEVEGDFDDCQRLVKQAFADRDLSRAARLTSANSINLGRLLPQMAYFASAAFDVLENTGRTPGFIIPTGNMGNAVACLWARACGAPVGEVVIAANANRALPDYFETGKYAPRPSAATLANAMDVGDPSNFARFVQQDRLSEGVSAVSVADDAIKARIRAEFETKARILCPHTAVGAEAFARLDAARKSAPWVLAATAHPYKFRETVEPLIGEAIAPPPAFEAIFGRKSEAKPIAAELSALAQALESGQ